MDLDDIDLEEKNIVIPSDKGIGIEFVHKSNKYVTVYNKEYPREVRLDITSWVGISSGAVHSYGSLKTDLWDLHFRIVELNKMPLGYKQYKAGDDCQWMGKGVPEEAGQISIRLNRKVTEADKLTDGGRAFEHHDIGDDTYRFNDVESLIEKAKQVFKKHFGKGWKLTIKKERKKKDKQIGEYYEDYWKQIAINK